MASSCDSVLRSMKNLKKNGDKADRQCWECLGRRLVCDRLLPHCMRCQKEGLDCPGFGEKKPLQWVQPGQVTTRRRWKNRPPKIYSALGQVMPEKELPHSSSSFTSSSSLTLQNDTETADYKEESIDQRSSALKSTAIADSYLALFSLDGQSRLDQIVKQKIHDVAAQILRTGDDPLSTLQRVLSYMRLDDIPRYHSLLHETTDLVQAINYYNLCILPDATQATLAPNPNLAEFSLEALYLLPSAMHYTLLCIVLNHFIYALPVGADRTAKSINNRSKLCQYRGHALRALNELVSDESTGYSTPTLLCIVVFLSMELQNATSTNWRSHAVGLQQIFKMRSGFIQTIREAPRLSSTLSLYAYICSFANTTSPAPDHLRISDTIEDTISDIKEVYMNVFYETLCPEELFLEIVRVSHLRHKASVPVPWASDEEKTNLHLEAQDLLKDIELFDSEGWAEAGPLYDEWLLIGRIYQSAAAIYCIMSLQSLDVLPDTVALEATRTTCGDQLLANLKKACNLYRVNRYVLWPLVVAGVEAGYRSESTQHWIEDRLSDTSRLLGTSSLLKARAVLRRYWQRDSFGWDECFDQSYVLVV